MLNSRQRAFLRGMANDYETIIQIGKGGISPALIKTVSEALYVRELIKIKALENSPVSAREAGEEIASKIGAEVVQVIGTKIVLFRVSDNEKNRKIELKKIN